MGPPGTSHSAAPGVDHSQGQHTSAGSELYNGFSKVSQYIYIILSRFFFYFADRKIKLIHLYLNKQMKGKSESGSLNFKVGFMQSTDN